MTGRGITLKVRKYSLLLRNIAWLSVASAAVKPIWFVFITVLCARVLGAEGYGVLNTALSLAVLCFAFTGMGINPFIVREIASDPSLASKYYSNFVILRSILTVLAVLVTIGTGLALGYSDGLLVALLIACMFYFAHVLFDFSHVFFQAFENLRYQAFSVIAEKALVVGLGTSLLFWMATPSAALLGMSVGISIAAAGSLAWTQRRLAPFRWDLLDPRFVLRILPPLLPFGIASLLGMIFFRIDTIIVEALLGLSAAGQYGLSFRIVEALNMLPMIVVFAATYPRLSREWKNGQIVEVRSLVLLVSLPLLAASIAIAALIMFWAPSIISWMATDPTLLPSADVLAILVWAFPLTCVRSVMYAVLLAMHAQRFIAIALGVGVILNVALNLWLIPLIGVVGAAVATLISEIILFTLLLWRYLSSAYN